MKTASNIKRGSIVTNILPISEGRLTHPAGTVGQVLRRKRTGQILVKFRDGYGVNVKITDITPAPTTNQKTPVVGDLFYSSWGYDQTNIDFYQIVAMKGCTASVRRCAAKQVSYSQMQGVVKADKGNLSGDTRNYRVTYSVEGEPSFKVASYARAWPTNENEEHNFTEWH
jgi:hypothetical protein